MKRQPPEQSIGQKYGNLTVVEIVNTTTSRGEKFVRCVCNCGNEKICQLRLIRRGSITGCGCTKQKTAKENIKQARNAAEKSGYFQSPQTRTQQMIYRKRYSDGDLCFDEFINLSQLPCFYCGSPPLNTTTTYKKGHVTYDRWKNSFFTYNGLDRVDNSQPHNKDNVVPCCKTCNTAKLNRSQKDFFNWIEKVHSNLFSKRLANE
jgi:hypothetical protein